VRKCRLSKSDQAVVDELLRRLAGDDRAERATREAFGVAWTRWVESGGSGPRPVPPERPQGDPNIGGWVPVRFPGDRRQVGELSRLRTSREERALRYAVDGRRARHAKAGRASAASKARVAKEKSRGAPEVSAKERRMLAAIRDAVREGEADRKIVRMMRARGYHVGREKVAEIRRSMRPRGLA
jgi:hypothetical protein